MRNGVKDVIKQWKYNQGYLATIKYEKQVIAVRDTTQNISDNLPYYHDWQDVHLL